MAQVQSTEIDRLLMKISGAAAGEPVAEVLATLIIMSMTYQLGDNLTPEEEKDSVEKVSAYMADLAETFYKQRKATEDFTALDPTTAAVN